MAGCDLAGAGHNVLRVLPGDRAWDRDEHPQSRLVQPGLATALALHLPIGIYYIVFVNNAHLVRGSDYLYGALGFIAAVVLIVILPVQGTKKRDNPYPFTAAELNGFGMHDKLVARGVI